MRNSSLSPDQRYDTGIAMQQPASSTTFWEIQVPNGIYSVRLVAGDATNTTGVYKIDVEGVAIVNGAASSATRWFEGTQVVPVTDGRLTITNAAGASGNKLNFVEILRVQ